MSGSTGGWRQTHGRTDRGRPVQAGSIAAGCTHAAEDTEPVGRQAGRQYASQESACRKPVTCCAIPEPLPLRPSPHAVRIVELLKPMRHPQRRHPALRSRRRRRSSPTCPRCRRCWLLLLRLLLPAAVHDAPHALQHILLVFIVQKGGQLVQQQHLQWGSEAGAFASGAGGRRLARAARQAAAPAVGARQAPLREDPSVSGGPCVSPGLSNVFPGLSSGSIGRLSASPAWQKPPTDQQWTAGVQRGAGTDPPSGTHPRALGQRARDRHALLLPAAEAAGGALCKLGEAHLRQRQRQAQGPGSGCRDAQPPGGGAQQLGRRRRHMLAAC